MPSFIDSAFLNQAHSIQPPNYLADFYNSFNLAQTLPWSAREQRKRAIEDHGIAMQQARFSADMAQQARQNQIEDMLLPYKLQQAQRLASGIRMTPSGSSSQGSGDWTSEYQGLLTDSHASQPEQDVTFQPQSFGNEIPELQTASPETVGINQSKVGLNSEIRMSGPDPYEIPDLPSF